MPKMGSPLDRPLTPLFTEALSFAADIHRHQLRKGTRIPYFAHILGVTSIALEYGADEKEAIGAVLHDSIEDAPPDLGADAVRAFIRLKFGDRILAIVEACTDADVVPKPSWRNRKEAYIADIAHKDASALLVGAADKLHNAAAILADYRRIGTAVFERFNADAGRDGTLWYYKTLATSVELRASVLRDERLARLSLELTRAVETLIAETHSTT